MIFPSCVIKNRDQKKSQNSGMTFLVFLNIFFTISMYQLKKKFCGYIHLKVEKYQNPHLENKNVGHNNYEMIK